MSFEDILNNNLAVGGCLALVLGLLALVLGLNRSRRRAQDRARHAAARYRASFDQSPIGMAELDPDGVVVGYNEALGVLLQLTKEEMIGQAYCDLVDEQQRPMWSRSFGRGRVPYRLSNGLEIWVEESSTEFDAGSDGGLSRSHQLVSVVDVSEERKNRDELQRRVLHDGLTHLPNRTLMGDRIIQALIRGQRYGTVTAVIFIDIDDFKSINDRLGHSAGDLLLREVARRLRSNARISDTIARFGGDEFVMLCEGLATPDDARILANRLKKTIAAPVDIGERTLSITLSIGIAVSNRVDNPEALLRDADLAMYQAKQAGHDHVVMFDSEIRELAAERLVLEDELRRAITDGGLRLHYQPVLDLETNRVVGYESLVRWLHPMRGLMNPGDFLPMAERLDLLTDIDAWTLETALGQLAEWLRRKQVPPECVIGINASALNFVNAAYPSMVKQMLERTGLSPDRLVIELAEEAVLANTGWAAKVISELRSSGVRVAIDNFGAGYSSFSQLSTVQFDILKINRSFTEGMREESGQEVMAALITMAQALGLRTVVEGVESPEDLDRLRGFGSNMAQGFAIARPMTALDILDVVKEMEHEIEQDTERDVDEGEQTAPLNGLSIF